MSEYVVIIEEGETSWGAWVPDLPGCVAAADSRTEVERLIREAIRLHVEQLRSRGEEVPAASAIGVARVEVS